MNKRIIDLSFLKKNRIAHRGIYDNKRIYENTISAFTRALKYNYIIELDVRMMACGTLVVFHDENMERLLHVEQDIEKITYDELCYMSKFQIPTLLDVLELVNGSVPLLIELKTIAKKGIFESKVAELLDNYKGEYAIQSFNLKSLKWFYKNRKNVAIGYLMGKKNYRKEHFFRKYDFINIHYGLLEDKKIRKMKEDKMIIAYGIKDKAEFDLKKDVYDNLTCDNLLEIEKV